MNQYHMNLLAARVCKINVLAPGKKNGNMHTFVYGKSRGNSRLVGTKKKRKITGKKN